MEEQTIKIRASDFQKLLEDVAQIKELLLNRETELTDWAKDELVNARKRKAKISHEEARRMILSK